MVEREHCPVCQRNVKSEYMTIHHYKPKCQGGTLDDTMRMCKCCHENLHYFIEIEDVPLYDSIDKLEEHEEYSKYLHYIRNVEHTAMVPVKRMKKKLSAA